MRRPPRFVYKVVLVADGNFKADHVRQQSDRDVWLMDGAGVSPNHDKYFTFLASAIERFTVHKVSPMLMLTIHSIEGPM